MSLKRKDNTTHENEDAKKLKKNGDLTSFFKAPKVQSILAPAEPTAKFDKDKWVASLTAEQKQLLKLEIDTLDPSWLSVLKEELVGREFLELKRFLAKEVKTQTIYPPMADVYSWSRHCPLNKVRVVILGQDPYHGPRQAHGLCFSVLPPEPAPPSLGNIYKAIANDYPSFKPPPKKGGLLTPWADQGVLLLNTCLTVRARNAGSHQNQGWERFTQKVIDTVVKVRTNGVVFLAWGSPAQKRCDRITGPRHLVLKSVHPSPLSAHKPPGFFNNKHFRKANDWLEERYGKDGPINWNLDISHPVKPPGNVLDGQAKPTEEEFPGVDDEDDIEALEEIAKLEAEGKAGNGTL
ncbi:uracil-DNA glycosylase [Exophiala aquamarina CBS 119918]|uniref:Uracil-DNA glycosylase n=1 Tax=Exophiala aquamarina CBS 119918 TaxID=1182545 RepID=A0A072NT96_9EURO|nr:uracil-DNA glycosylase [Exophiala aquamarina CBS 119918]KEF51104.1 uracil-DNA glycosylase [Exophiala aquamarina CBS 119918]